ncbi:MAG: beta-lactamase [Geminicoccaceae bacterium]|nr:beta-lactamase [Geminicoccaceae bacterium]
MVHHISAVFAMRLNLLAPRRVRARTLLLACGTTVAYASVSAQGPTSTTRPTPPAPDVYLATLAVDGGTVTVGAPLNITDRPGYDNQPSFTWDGTAVFFTSVRDDAQADIYRFDIASGTTVRVTTTAPESEYSATPIDSGRAISVVRVERDSAQRLWRFPLNGGAPAVVLDRVKPVGYHAWADERTLALFVLGNPNSLQLANVRSGSVDTIATGIGRSLHRMPGARTVSFVRKVSPTEWWIESLEISTRRTNRLVQLPEGVEDYAWMPDGSILCGRGSALLRWSGKTGDEWRPVSDFGASGLKGITRIAVSPRGDRVAFVADGR